MMGKERHTFDIIEEPRGELLRRVINAAAKLSSGVMMVLRGDLDLNDTG